MIICIKLLLEPISDVFSIITPIILFFWFLFSRKQTLSRKYFKELVGLYAGYILFDRNQREVDSSNSGIIMNIKAIDEKGFFKGEFDSVINYSDDKTIFKNSEEMFFGEMFFSTYLLKNKYLFFKRNPFKPKQNRVYLGKLYIVDRLDFNFENYKIDNYICAEYKVIHHREMGTLQFEYKETREGYNNTLPKKFTLYKSAGFSFEPYAILKKSVFFK